MRVAHLVPALFGPDGITGGAERFAFELARHMADVVPTSLVTFGDVSREEQAGSLRIHVIGRPWLVRGQRTNPFHASMFARLRHAEVVHCHQRHVVASSAAAAWSRVTGRRVFVSELGGGGWDISGYLSTDGWFHGHLHLSEYSRQVFGHATHARAHVIGGGVDVRTFVPAAAPAAEAGVLFVGRLLPHKGVDDLIQGLPDRMRLTVVGPAPDGDTLARLVRLSRGKNVRFLHDLDDADLVREYQRALCVVLPSVYRTADGRQTRVPELLGQTLLEGMACGRPAICTDVASMPEIVEHGVTGFVVPPNDPASIRACLEWMAAQRAEADRMGDAARRRVLERFAWPGVVNRCLEVYARAWPPVEAGYDAVSPPSGAQS